MSYLLTDIGEEWYTETALSGASIDVGLYNDGTDQIADMDDIGAVTTEPSGASYARQSDTVSVVDLSGNWGIQNDTLLQFDVSDSSVTVDGALLLATFDSDEAGDGGTATTHLIGTSQLSQSRNLSQIELFEIDAGDAAVSID